MIFQLVLFSCTLLQQQASSLSWDTIPHRNSLRIVLWHTRFYLGKPAKTFEFISKTSIVIDLIFVVSIRLVRDFALPKNSKLVIRRWSPIIYVKSLNRKGSIQGSNFMCEVNNLWWYFKDITVQNEINGQISLHPCPHESRNDDKTILFMFQIDGPTLTLVLLKEILILT